MGPEQGKQNSKDIGLVIDKTENIQGNDVTYWPPHSRASCSATYPKKLKNPSKESRLSYTPSVPQRLNSWVLVFNV